MTDEKQDLDNLLKHPGWLRVTNFAQKDIQGRLDAALANAANTTEDVLAINLVRQCVAVRQAITAFLEWPEARLKVLTAADAQRTAPGQLSRRGDL